METSKTIYTFRHYLQDGHNVLEAQQWPWTVAQVVPVAPGQSIDDLTARLHAAGFAYVAQHDRDKSFVIVHACSGDQAGKYHNRHVNVTQSNYPDVLAAVRDTLAQAAVWWATNRPIYKV